MLRTTRPALERLEMSSLDDRWLTLIVTCSRCFYLIFSSTSITVTLNRRMTAESAHRESESSVRSGPAPSVKPTGTVSLSWFHIVI